MTANQDFFGRLEDLIRYGSNDSSLGSAAEVLKRWGCPSTSIAVLDNGNITSHSISSVGNDTESLFQACSISKPTAGMAMMKLIEEGLLSLDDKICDRLPEHITQHLLSDSTTAPIVRTITLKHLLSHTSGLSQGGFPGYADRDNVPSTTDIVTGGPLVNTMPVKLITLPGLEFMYSGGGCVLLQMIMERVTQKPFDQIMDEYVLRPLNMTRSCYKLPPGETNMTRCFYNGNVPTEAEYHVIPEQGAAGLWTTPTDLLKLIRAMQTSLEPGTDTNTSPFMRTETAQDMLAIVKAHICLTWFASDDQFGHSGGNAPAYRCFAYGYASLPWNKNKNESPKNMVASIPRKCGIAIMTNAEQGIQIVSLLLHAITYLKGWPQNSEFGICLSITSPIKAPPGSPINSAWKGWLGVQWSDAWSLVEDEGGAPGVRLPGSGNIVHPLVPAAIPSRKYEGGKESVDLMLDGLRLMIRLDWDGDERIVEFWNGGRAERVVMRAPKIMVKQEAERNENMPQ